MVVFNLFSLCVCFNGATTGLILCLLLSSVWNPRLAPSSGYVRGVNNATLLFLGGVEKLMNKLLQN